VEITKRVEKVIKKNAKITMTGAEVTKRFAKIMKMNAALMMTGAEK
jgi:hypothetical protein